MIEKLQSISSKTLISERDHALSLINYLKPYFTHLASNIENKSREYIEKLKKTKASTIESFLNQYSLTTAEGVSVICLAEALLRIPDNDTAKDLINDKIRDKQWTEYLGKSDSFLTNASTWGLILTGKLINLRDSDLKISKVINRIGESAVLAAIQTAIKILSNEYIISNDIENALQKAKKYQDDGYGISYDILGESSRNDDQAESYYQKYIKAISIIAKYNPSNLNIYTRTNLSIKLSALHPRIELSQNDRLQKELTPRLFEIIKKCHENSISISFDAEEGFRQDIYLKIITEAFNHFSDYGMIGFVIQAYSKRSFDIIDYICDLHKSHMSKIPIRLVKGAYWDSEIKYSQEQGLDGYPVFTHKIFTDLSYLACAHKILANSDKLYGQFATHNAYTAAAIQAFAKASGESIDFEFQKLHGMGNNLHSQIIADGYHCRIYSPVGEYKDLLAYLMRRMLENSGNTSFLNMIHQENISVNDLVKNPLQEAERILNKEVIKNITQLTLPADIFPSGRKNSAGYELGIDNHYISLKQGIQKYQDKKYESYSIIDGIECKGSKNESCQIIRPGNIDETVGVWYKIDNDQIKSAIDKAHNSFISWSNINVNDRANILEKFADIMQENRYELYSLLIREAGKNIRDCIGEVREAIDFARYYASEGRRLMGNSIIMPGYTGESNKLSLHSKGIFVCISPWNFPLAIFCGQILAALVTGNTVIAKPSENTPTIASFAIKLLHQAGIPEQALHLVLGYGKDVGDILLSDSRISGVCFTGSTITAMNINRTLAARNAPIATLIAETGGQNAMIVDSSALIEQVSDSAIYSAFGSAGQRCSALRMLYVQKEIYHDTLNMIKGAMNELSIGDTISFYNDIGPVINQSAADNLRSHITNMKEKGFNVIEYIDAKLSHSHKNKTKDDEEYIKQYHKEMKQGHFFYPHIIEVNSITDIGDKENFGPILHIAQFELKDLDNIIQSINDTEFGLTFGMQSRIQSRTENVTKKIRAGNIYINRSTIGAQVESHPFGGEKNSGTGFKAGGPHYLLKFITERTVTINETAVGGNMSLLSNSLFMNI